MKGNEIIDNITYDIRIKMPDIEQVRENCLNQTAGEIIMKPKNIPWKRYAIMVAAIMIIFTMVVSAVTIAYKIYNDMYMLPNMGLFEGFNENVLAMPKVLEFGDGTIEAAMTYEKDGGRKFYMLIHAEGGGNSDKNPEKRDYEKLEIVFSDGISIFLEGKPSSSGNGQVQGASKNRYFFAYEYEYENFPDGTEFTVKNNAGMSTDVALKQIEPRTMKITDDGLKRVKIIPAAEGSRLFSHNIEIINPSLAENEAIFVNYLIKHSWSWEDNPANVIYYKNGTKSAWNYGSSVGYGVPVFAVDESVDYKFHVFGETYFDYNFISGGIDKIIIRELEANLTFNDYSIKVALPVPEKGERIDYETPLKIAEVGEFTISVNAIERERNNLYIYMSEDDISYAGNEDVSGIMCSISDSNGDGSSTGDSSGKYFYRHTLTIPDGYSGDTFEAYISSLSYMIQGYWEIDFD